MAVISMALPCPPLINTVSWSQTVYQGLPKASLGSIKGGVKLSVYLLVSPEFRYCGGKPNVKYATTIYLMPDVFAFGKVLAENPGSTEIPETGNERVKLLKCFRHL